MPRINKKKQSNRPPSISKRPADDKEQARDTITVQDIHELEDSSVTEIPTAAMESITPQIDRKLSDKRKRKLTSETSSVTTQIPVEDLDSAQIDRWGWSKIQIPDGALLTGAEDVGGFMMLEELVGVDIAQDENDGRLLVFKKVGNSITPSRVVNHESPLSEIEMDNLRFIHVDSILPDDNPADIKRLEQEEIRDSLVIGQINECAVPDDSNFEASTLDFSCNQDRSSNRNVKLHCKITDEPSPTLAEDKRVTVKEPSDFRNMAAWTDAIPSLSPWLLKGLFDQGFTTPTPIQAETLPLAIQTAQNVVGAAETGSGKTLAFGLPILNHIVTRTQVSNRPIGLVLSPTRELALQIAIHLKAIIKPFSYSHPLNRINIVTLVGGFSEDKQRRLLNRGAHILIATPGRLWDMIESGQLSSASLDSIRFIGIDEADRMLESGKFKELENIMSILNRSESTTEWNESSLNLLINPSVTKRRATERQMFVFSATLPISTPSHSFRGKEITLTHLLAKLNLKQYATVDVNGGNKMTSNLIESKIDCTPEDKEVHLYYLLSRYPGRTLVFVNAISTIRRLVPILQLLRVKVLPLHAQMQQRQRIKNLENFAAAKDGILIASDIASRGIDIKDIDHVIHFQVPLTSDLYVHRSGRTARGTDSSGLSIVMVSPKELPAYHKICKRLGKAKLPEFPIELQFINEFRKRFKVAQRLETMKHSLKKKAHNRTWENQIAEALDIELSEEEHDSDVEIRSKSQRATQQSQLQSHLNEMLDRIILPKGTKKRYITSDVATALNSSTNQTMPVAGTKALDDFCHLKKKMRK